jgi:hypothetical protein
MLSPLQETFCPLEPKAMLKSARLIVRCYQQLARPLALQHGFEYPDQLDKIILKHLELINL